MESQTIRLVVGDSLTTAHLRPADLFTNTATTAHLRPVIAPPAPAPQAPVASPPLKNLKVTLPDDVDQVVALVSSLVTIVGLPLAVWALYTSRRDYRDGRAAASAATLLSLQDSFRHCWNAYREPGSEDGLFTSASSSI